MRRIYMSFLGRGAYRPEEDAWRYDSTCYELDGDCSRETAFVQAAELELLGPRRFDRVILVATRKSYDTHFRALEKELKTLGVAEIVPSIISEEMTPEGQWNWFETILAQVEPGDELTLDLTNGYRSIPIVFSTAVNFLQKARGVTLGGVYYGAYDRNRRLVPLVDMKSFYAINEWAEAVSRLVEDADARKMAELSEGASAFQASALKDEKLIAALNDLTNAVRNIDANRVGEKARKALGLAGQKREQASLTEKMLLDLVLEKFDPLVEDVVEAEGYNAPYLRLQAAMVGILLEHKLYMQAFTAMRELIGSMGMMGVKKPKDKATSKGRNQRRRYGEVFLRMLHLARDDWDFQDSDEAKCTEELTPFYERLEQADALESLRGILPELSRFRNGFDHAWTTKMVEDPEEEIPRAGKACYEGIRRAMRILEEKRLPV